MTLINYCCYYYYSAIWGNIQFQNQLIQWISLFHSIQLNRQFIDQVFVWLALNINSDC